jgi:hypothetical protein
MDDAVRPQDAPGDADGSETSSIEESPEAIAAPAPTGVRLPGDEGAPRLDLDRDPFAPVEHAYPVLDPDPFIPAIDSEPVPDAPAEEPEAVLERSVEDMSIEDMVGDLESAEERPEESPEADAEAAVTEDDMAAEEVPVGESEPAEEGDEEPEPTSWRDAVAASSEVAVPELVRHRLATRLPFWIYGGTWAVLVGALIYLMWPVADKPSIDSPYYVYLVFGGAGMLAVGLVMAIVVWAASRPGASKAELEGLGRAICMRTAGWMAVGVIIWWVGMYALDLHRIGVIG